MKGKLMQFDVIDDARKPAPSPTDTPREFKGRYEVIDGKRVLVVETQAETVVHPDGRKDVIIHAPTLDMMNQAAG
jgi:urease gamma subunit